FITVVSRDLNRANDNKPRTLLYAADEEKLREVLEDDTKVAFVMQALQDRETVDEGAAASQPAASQPADGKAGDGKPAGGKPAGGKPGSTGGASGDGAPGSAPIEGGMDGGTGKNPGGASPGRTPRTPTTPGRDPSNPPKDKGAPRMQQQRQPVSTVPGKSGRQPAPSNPQPTAGSDKPPTDDAGASALAGIESMATTQPSGDENAQGENAENNNAGGAGHGQRQRRRVQTPADLLKPRLLDGAEQPSPLTEADLPLLLDKFTTVSSPELQGVINVNTAPVEVLVTLPGIDETLAQSIVTSRSQLDSHTKETPAWLITQGVLDYEHFDAIYKSITARGMQFTIESLGYADHLGQVTRLQAIIEMRGPLAQVMYYRDLTALGATYPLRTKRGDYQLVGVHH
ncbi:MAG TPA: hypothetical protein VGM03_13695, partial [Phycisphaerae bacterium]